MQHNERTFPLVKIFRPTRPPAYSNKNKSHCRFISFFVIRSFEGCFVPFLPAFWHGHGQKTVP